MIEPHKRESSLAKELAAWIGGGEIGGKAKGLLVMQKILPAQTNSGFPPCIEVSIPSFVVLRTEVFDRFMTDNGLHDTVRSNPGDTALAIAFQHASLPADILGDLHGIVDKYRGPLAIRSSSMLEDSLREPFAGVYETKMSPNNQHSRDERFRKLLEAIKFVYASTYFRAARDYVAATGRGMEEEKMAVIIQEVVGQHFGDRFYPVLSGVARSYNYYAVGRTKPEDGIVSLALGLGKTIVDGGRCWTYSPRFPAIGPPVGSTKETLATTQADFWAVNMGKLPAYDPIRETEFLVNESLDAADHDGTLTYLASTYDANADKLTMGTGVRGPKALTFAFLLRTKEIPVNDVILNLLSLCAESFEGAVEVEFAMTFNPYRFAVLQARPMVVSSEEVDLTSDEFGRKDALVASENVLGNGIVDSIRDIVYVKPETFRREDTTKIAAELAQVNGSLLTQKKPYVLLGFGRWGSSDPSLGIPVQWGQISGAKAIVEITPNMMSIELSQGSHFFHNLASFRVSYFCVSEAHGDHLRWELLDGHQVGQDLQFVRHVILVDSVLVKIDGRTRKGVILLRNNIANGGRSDQMSRRH